jgi:hypothetical protein
MVLDTSKQSRSFIEVNSLLKRVVSAFEILGKMQIERPRSIKSWHAMGQ